MSQYNVSFDLKGPAGIALAIPNKTNPVEAERLDLVLDQLSASIAKSLGFGLEIIGVRVEKIE